MKTFNMIAIILVVIVLAALIWLGVASERNQVGNISTSTASTTISGITYENASSDMITVELPYPGAVTGKTFSVIGKVRGQWYFEASFPVKVTDAKGNVLWRGAAQAQGDWQTTDFVPFKAEITVPESYTGPAILILQKDNPSGLPDKDASVSFPFVIEY